MSLIRFFAFSFLSHLVLFSSAEEKKENYQSCPRMFCDELGEFGYPFTTKPYPGCGLYTVNCSKPVPKIQFKRGGNWFHVERISQFDTVLINDTSSPSRLDPHSCESIESCSLPNTSFSNTSTTNSWTLFNCSRSLGIAVPGDFHRTRCRRYEYDIYYTTVSYASFPFAQQCSTIQLPPFSPQTRDNKILLSTSFTVDVFVASDCVTCHYKGGQCEAQSKNKYYCSITTARKGHPRKVVVIAALAAAAAASFILIASICCLRKKWSSNKSIFIWKKQSPTDKNIEAFLKHYGPLQARRYNYLDVKKMTNSFKDKLGQGGFGSVYKGKLHDGCLVAVKVLDESKANGEEFINEVAAISRTSHVNIVSLLGFCFEGTKRALIYEFMVNGSLEKFVFDEHATENGHQLDWETYYQISLGIARGLEYLHRGCNTRILHFDIKPHNILLDADFAPKISDFGLARICTRKESLISMLGPRGTIGYIAPEVFSRNFGGISHKSDVYSFGMMVLEMVGGRKNVNIGAGNTSEIYFPHWIYKRLELDEDFGLKRIMSQEDGVKVRKMIIVSLWCIQTDPSNRPAMSGVIEMLEGSLDSLQVPPKPFLSSPSRSPPADFSSTF